MNRMFTSLSIEQTMNLVRVEHKQLSEQEIIDLSTIFLTKGVHYIQVENVARGRQLMRAFLNSLNYYHDIAYLGMTPFAHTHGYHNVYAMLQSQGVLENQHLMMADFLCNNLYCDFLWIEATEPLLKSAWFELFEDNLFALNFDQIMPILIVSYQQG